MKFRIYKNSMLKNRTLYQSFKNALKGLFYSIKKERNIKIQMLFGFVVFLLASLFSFTYYEWIVLTFAVFFIIVAELFNTSIEYLIDLITLEYNKKAKKSKDIAASAVLITSMISLGIIISLFIRKVL